MSDLKEKLKEKVRNLPDKPGVYLMRDRIGQVIYVGKAKSLKDRVRWYFMPSQVEVLKLESPKIAQMIELIWDFDFIILKSEQEALIFESQLIKELKPKYNTLAKDDKKYILVKLNIQDPIPQFKLTRNKTDSKSMYFGPFISSLSVKKTLYEMRLQYGVLLWDANPKRLEDGSYQLYGDVRSEIYGHSNIVSTEEYRLRIAKAAAFLKGKTHELVDEVEVKMYEASKNKTMKRPPNIEIYYRF